MLKDFWSLTVWVDYDTNHFWQKEVPIPWWTWALESTSTKLASGSFETACFSQLSFSTTSLAEPIASERCLCFNRLTITLYRYYKCTSCKKIANNKWSSVKLSGLSDNFDILRKNTTETPEPSSQALPVGTVPIYQALEKARPVDFKKKERTTLEQNMKHVETCWNMLKQSSCFGGIYWISMGYLLMKDVERCCRVQVDGIAENLTWEAFAKLGDVRSGGHKGINQ